MLDQSMQQLAVICLDPANERREIVGDE